MIYCSHCGTGPQSPDAYCKHCGQWLPDQTRRGHSKKNPEQRVHSILVFNILSAVFGLFSAIALYATYLGTPEAKWSIYVAGAFCSVIAVHQTISFVFTLQLRQRFKEARGDAGQITEPASPAALLNRGNTGELIRQASITDNTTSLLEAGRPARQASAERPVHHDLS